MGEEKEQLVFSEELRCEHCGNRAPMQKVAQYSNTGWAYDEKTGMQWEEGPIYELLKCPACLEVMLRRYFWTDLMEPQDVEFKLLYPSSDRIPPGLPPKVKKAYEAALRVRGVDPNAFGVLLGRVLELVCEDRAAEGRYLGHKLDNLAKRAEIPDKLVAVANGLKDLRNVGAHASLGELTTNEVPILADLCRAVLEYVYSAPHLADEAEWSLARLRRRRGSNSRRADKKHDQAKSGTRSKGLAS